MARMHSLLRCSSQKGAVRLLVVMLSSWSRRKPQELEAMGGGSPPRSGRQTDEL